MPNYKTHLFVCTHAAGAPDKRHCGDKGGLELRKQFDLALTKYDLRDDVTISNVGCTSAHGACNTSQGNIIIYGPSADMGGTWYTVGPDDVENVVTNHIINGEKLPELQYQDKSVDFPN